MAVQDHKALLAIVTAAFVTLFAYQKISLYLTRRAFKKEHGCQPARTAYPLKDPFFGLDWILASIKAGKEHKLLELGYNRLQKYGPTYTSRIIRQPLIITIEPQNIKTVLSLRFKDFGIGERHGTFGRLLGKGIFTTDGEQWAHSRHMIRPNFARDQVADLSMLERHVSELLPMIPTDGRTVDLQDMFFRLTIDSATEFLFGESVQSQRAFRDQQHLHGTQDSSTSFAEAFNYAQHDVATRSRLGALKFLHRDAHADECVRVCHEFVGRYVDNAIKYRAAHDLEKAPVDDDEKYVFLHTLAKETTDPVRLRDELLNVLLAGRDTTAGLLSNLFFELARNPEMWAKLREEVGALDGELPTYDQLRNMKYLKYCLNESLRLHPVVPGNARFALRDTVLPLGGGPDGKSPLFIAKGTIVGYSTYTMHRSAEYFSPDPLAFRPERWETLRPGWEYLPFNGGPRICLGQQYALTEAGYVVCRLAQRFARLESRADGEWREALTLTLACGGGTKVGCFAE